MPTPVASAGAVIDPGTAEARPRPSGTPDLAWRERALSLAAQAERARDRRTAAELWLGAAALHADNEPREPRGPREPARAIELAERALALVPALPAGLDLLERLHAGDAAALCERLARAAALAREPADRAAIHARLAVIQRDLLGDSVLARRDAERALALDPACGPAAALLVEAHLTAGRPAEAAAVLARHLAVAGPGAAAAPLRTRVADAALMAGERTLSAELLEAALRDAPGDAVLAVRLEAAWEEAGAWERLGAVLTERAASAPAAERPALWLRLARCRAAAGDHAGHAAVLEDLARSHELPRERARAWLGAAALRAGRLGDLRGAFACAAAAFRADPADPQAREACERFAEEAGCGADLYALYDEVAPRLCGTDERALRLRLADLAEHDPARRAAASDHLRRALELAPGDGEALARLARLEMAAGHWPEARELVASRAAAATGLERAALLEKLAEIAGERLGDAEAAAAALEGALRACPDDARPRLARKLAQALGVLAATADGPERARLERRVASLAAEELRQDALAFAALVRAVRADPGDAAAREALVCTACAAGSGADAARVLREVAVTAGDAASGVLAALARLCAEHLHDAAAACEAWEAAHALWPRDPVPLEALRRLQRDLGRWPELARTCAALGEVAASPAERLDALREAARATDASVAAGAGDRAEAREAWRAVLAHAPGDEEAAEALERILEALDDPAALAAHLEARRAGPGADQETRRAGSAAHLEAAPARDVARTFRLAELRRLRLGAPGDALALHEVILAAEPEHAGARAALLELCAVPGDVGRSALARADALVPAGSPEWVRAAAAAPCAALDRRAARALEQAGDVAGALAAWRRVHAAAPSDAEALDALERLLGEGDPAALRAEVARARIADARGEERRIRAIRAAELAQAAGDAEGALAAWSEALALDPADRRAMAALAALARRPEAWDRAARALEAAHRARGDARALAAVLAARAGRPGSAVPGERGALWREVGALRERLGDAQGACDALARAAEAEPSGNAWAALARARGRAGDEAGRVTALARLAAAEPSSRRAAEARREVAEMAERLGDRDGAIGAWREVLAWDPENPEALERLDRLLESAGRWEELLPVLARRAELLRAHPNRVADAAEFHVRAGRVRQERLGDEDGALACYREAIDRSPAHGPARAALHALALSGSAGAAAALEPAYEREGAHAPLAELLAARATAEARPAARAATLARLAALRAGPLSEPEAAFLDAASALRDDPDCAPALALAVDLAPRAGLEDALDDLLAGCAAGTKDAAQRTTALRSLARRARDPARAAAAWGEVLEAAGDRSEAGAEASAEAGAEAIGEALDGLAAAHRAAGDLAALARTLRRRLTTALDPSRRARLLDELARAELERGEAAAAADALQERLDQDPAGYEDRALLGRLDEALAAAGRWSSLADALAREITFADADGDREAARALRVRLAGLRDERRGDRDGAIALLEEVLAEAPGDAGALAALELVLEEEPGNRRAAGALLAALEAGGDAERLAHALERHAGACEDPAARKALLLRLAELREALHAPGAAFAAALEAFRGDPGDPALRAPLQRLAALAGEEEELAAAWEDAAEALPAPGSAGLALALGALWDHLGAPARAVDWYARARAAEPDREGELLPELDRLCAAATRWGELEEVLRLRAARADGAERAELLARRATLVEERLGDATGALAAWTEVLSADSASLAAHRARARLACAAGDLEPQVALVEALAAAGQPAEAAEAARAALDAGLAPGPLAGQLVGPAASPDADALAARLDAACARAGAAAERARIAEARAEALGTEAKAEPSAASARAEPSAAAAWLDATARWDEAGEPHRATAALEHALAADPASAGVLEVLRDRLAAAGEWARLAGVCAEHADRVEDPRARAALLAEAAELQEAHLDQPELAFLAWCRALQADPASTAAAEGAARLAAAAGSWEELAALWEQVAETVEGTRRAAALHALGVLRAGRLADPQGAVGAWRAALDADPGAEAPREALCAALARDGRHAELADALARAAEAAKPIDRPALLRRLAQVREERLADPAAALEAWRALREAAPDAADAADAVIRLAERAGRWEDLHAALIARAGSVLAGQRLGLLARAASVAEERLGDPARALASATAMLDADPACADALARLARLHGVLGNPAGRAVALERSALLAAGGERAALCLAAAEARRAAGDGAGEERALREALRADPEAREALDALAHLHEERGDAVSALELLDRLAALAPDDAQAGAALARAAHLHERRGDRAAALAMWRRALEAEPSHLEALRALRQAAEGSRDRALALELLAREARVTREPAERARLCAVLAAHHRDDRGDLDEAARWLEEAVAALPGDPGAAAELADVRLAAGDLASAERLLELAADAEGVPAREAARRWHRLAVVRERLGRRPESLVAERRAQHADPSYLPAALVLPRLLSDAGAGDEALAAFRALLAHHAPALTPGEVAAAHAESGVLEERAGRPGRAMASYAAALEADPDDARTRERLAALLEAQGDVRGALAHHRLQAARLSGPARAAALTRVGVLCQEKLADRRAAAEAFEAALKIDPACLDALARLEPLLVSSGRERDLERHLRAALEALPQGPAWTGRRLALWRALAALYAGPLHDAGAARTAAEVVASIEADDQDRAGG